METKPLMRDLSRCYGDLGKEVCEDREQCLRFLTMRIDLPDVLSYVLTLRMSNSSPCMEKIE
ncbi:MAG: hypothetical protein LUQ26_00670 [Methylococcaceae bacterium]|nr:hypothetical protein [Methylococcaceae bacterium]